MIQWLCNKIVRIGNRYDNEMSMGKAVLIEDSSSPDMQKAIKFSVLPARGGCILETRTIDPKTHDWDVVSHIIPEGTDVAEHVGKIVAMEMLRR